MALPKKRSRILTVEGGVFRWMVTARHKPEFGFVVEHAHAPAQRLLTHVGLGHTITPEIVASCVAIALERGWSPAAPGPDFRTTCPASLLPGDDRAQCPCCDSFSLAARGQWDVCPVCRWEDDGVDVDNLDRHSGPNHTTLRDARRLFREGQRADMMGAAPSRAERFERRPRRLPGEPL